MKQTEKVTVVKLGGSLLEDSVRRGAALDAIAALARSLNGTERPAPLVLVHGGGKCVDEWQARLGLQKRTHHGIRITDEPTLDVVVAVLAGLVNKRIVAELAARGVPACGLSGADAGLLRAAPMAADGGIDFGLVGRVTQSDAGVLRAILASGHLPVVASLALGPQSQLLNVNADTAASALASSLNAGRLVFLTDVEGLLDDRGRRVPRLDAEKARSMLAGPAVTGGMRPKLDACLQALADGVSQIVIAGPRNQQRALRRGEGGTRLVAA